MSWSRPVVAGKIALHHVLVEAGGGDCHENTGKELLPEISAFLGVVEEEHARGRMVGDGRGEFAERVAEVAGYEIDAQHNRHYEAEALDGVGPDKGFNAALHCVEPNERYRDNDIEYKWYVQRPEDKQLKHGANHKEAHRSPEHL